MIFDDFLAKIEQNVALKPTKEQSLCMECFSEFVRSRQQNALFLLTGYAGTGKTTLVAAIVRTLVEWKQRVVLLAPTGRAAKVFSQHAGMPAFTIHRRIYREQSEERFSLRPAELNRDTLFVVDEASMIANEGLSGNLFGTGCLLDDLLQFVYGGQNCRLMLVGDSAQLPPVGETISPALSCEALEARGFFVAHCELTEVVRQLSDSGILWNATMLRNTLSLQLFHAFPQLCVKPFADICVVPGAELIESLEQSFYRSGADETIVVTRSNRRAVAFNNGIRARILGMEDELTSGDRIIVAKNNYFWMQHEPTPQVPQSSRGALASCDFIANGDMAVVRRFRNERELYGFRFADVVLEFPDYDCREVECTVLLDTLQAEAPSLAQEQQQQLFDAVWADYPDITVKRDRMKRLREDAYYNALQIKYAYAVTCHKAQGGQWEHVYIDQGYITEEMLTPAYFRWPYTALTRATQQVFLVNWPENCLC
ncbi:MAG: AAA family ATPase [Bacteroidales bacterium]|nr:AAA family ATPase [Candidatus Physcousia equi]